jgi:hypothetical protein
MHKCNFCGEFHVKHLVKAAEASICSDCLVEARGAIIRHRLLALLELRNIVGVFALALIFSITLL